jgi:hypothetical protein
VAQKPSASHSLKAKPSKYISKTQIDAKKKQNKQNYTNMKQNKTRRRMRGFSVVRGDDAATT